MRRIPPALLVLLAGCAGDHHETKVEANAPAAVEHEARGHHGHQATDGCEPDNIGQDLLEDAESGLIGGLLQALIDAIFRRGD